MVLQSCKEPAEPRLEIPEKKNKPIEAASYNARLGLAYLKQGNRERAKHKLFLALEQAPNDPTVNDALAYFMEKSGEIDKADMYYHKAMSMAPKKGAPLNNYGAFLCRQGKYKQAEVYFLKAVKDIQYEHSAGAYENAGLCVLAIPDKPKAVTYFSKALEQDPSRAQSLYELVKLKMNQGQYEQALVYLQKHQEVSFSNQALLALAASAAQNAGKTELEADYKMRLHRLANLNGDTNEYDTRNG